MRRWLLAGVAALLTLVGNVGAAAEGERVVVHLRGSNTAVPVIRALAEAFMAEQPNAVITVEGGPSVLGIKALIHDTIDIALSSSPVGADQQKLATSAGKRLVATPLGYDRILPVVHPANPLTSLSVVQLRDLFSGKISNWKQLGGPDLPVVVMAHGPLSGTGEIWNTQLMGRLMVTPQARILTSDQVREGVATQRGAIGYLARELVDTRVKVPLVWSSPAGGGTRQAQVIRREILLVHLETPTPAVRRFLDFALSLPRGRAIVREHGLEAIETSGGKP